MTRVLGFAITFSMVAVAIIIFAPVCLNYNQINQEMHAGFWGFGVLGFWGLGLV